MMAGGLMQNCIFKCFICFNLPAVGMLAKFGNVISPIWASQSYNGDFEPPRVISTALNSAVGFSVWSCYRKKNRFITITTFMVGGKSAPWSELFVSTCQLSGNTIQQESSTCWGPECQWEVANSNSNSCLLRSLLLLPRISIAPPKNINRNSKEYLFFLQRISIFPPKNIYFSSEEYLLLLRRISFAFPPKNIFCFPSSWEYLLQPLFLQRICITLFLWHQGDLKCSSYKIDKWQTMYYLNRFIRIFSS